MAWTNAITEATDFSWKNGQRLWKIKLTCTSDASASGDITLSTQLATDLPNKKVMDAIRGATFYGLEYVPDGTDTPTAGDATITITVDTESGANFFSEVVAVDGTAEWFDGTVDSGFAVPFTDLIFACTTLANTKKAVFNLWILK